MIKVIEVTKLVWTMGLACTEIILTVERKTWLTRAFTQANGKIKSATKTLTTKVNKWIVDPVKTRWHEYDAKRGPLGREDSKVGKLLHYKPNNYGTQIDGQFFKFTGGEYSTVTPWAAPKVPWSIHRDAGALPKTTTEPRPEHTRKMFQYPDGHWGVQEQFT